MAITKVTVLGPVTKERQREIIRLRLDGLSYAVIAKQFGVSRQRIQQIIAPPPEIAIMVRERAGYRCQSCDIYVGKSGHVHHKGDTEEDYSNVDELEYLCRTCHRGKHRQPVPVCYDPQQNGVVICPQCKGLILIRSGLRWRKNGAKRIKIPQYQCKDCGRKTTKPLMNAEMLGGS